MGIRSVRLLELQEIGPVIRTIPKGFVPEKIIRRSIEDRFGKLELINDKTLAGKGPSKQHWRIKGFKGTIGFISNMTKPICCRCDKLRLSATGVMKGCIIDSSLSNLRPVINDHEALTLAVGKIIHLMSKRSPDWKEKIKKRELDYNMRWNLRKSEAGLPR